MGKWRLDLLTIRVGLHQKAIIFEQVIAERWLSRAPHHGIPEPGVNPGR